MNRQMNKKSRRINLTASFDDVTLDVNHHQVARGDFAPRQPVRRAQEPIARPGHEHRQVITHALVERESIAQLVRPRELDARAPRRGVVPSGRGAVDVGPGRARFAVAQARVRRRRRRHGIHDARVGLFDRAFVRGGAVESPRARAREVVPIRATRFSGTAPHRADMSLDVDGDEVEDQVRR